MLLPQLPHPRTYRSTVLADVADTCRSSRRQGESCRCSRQAARLSKLLSSINMALTLIA